MKLNQFKDKILTVKIVILHDIDLIECPVLLM